MLFATGLVFVVWRSAIDGSFHYDDFANVVRDPVTLHPERIVHRLLHGIRPLTRLSYAWDYARGGMEARPFLVTNLLLHLATVAGVALLAGFWAAALFGLQPAAIEVVAYVSGRSTGLMAALTVWGLVAHTRSRTALSFALFAAACAAKEVALVFPLWLLLWDRYRNEERPMVAPVLGLGLWAAICTTALFASTHLRDLLTYSFGQRSAIQALVDNARALPQVLAAWGNPERLSIVQPFDASSSPLPGLFLWLSLLSCAVLTHRRFPSAAFAAGWVAAVLLPYYSIVVRNEPVTAKPLYLAWLGPATWIGTALTGNGARFRTAMLRACVTAILVFWGFEIRRQVHRWSDELTLWEHATQRAPESFVAWNNYGRALLGTSRGTEARGAFTRALSLEPESFSVRQNLEMAQLLSKGETW